MDKPDKLPKVQLTFVVAAAIIAGISCYPPISTMYDYQRYDQPIGILPLLGLALTAGLIGYHLAYRTQQPIALGVLAAALVSEWGSIYNIPFNWGMPEGISGLANLVFYIAAGLVLAGFGFVSIIQRSAKLKYLSAYCIGLLIFFVGQLETYWYFSSWIKQ